MNFVKVVFMWTGFTTWYALFVVGVGKALKRARIAQFGEDE